MLPSTVHPQTSNEDNYKIKIIKLVIYKREIIHYIFINLPIEFEITNHCFFSLPDDTVVGFVIVVDVMVAEVVVFTDKRLKSYE